MVASSHLVPGVLLCKEGELAHPLLTNTTMHLAKCVPLVETNGRGRYFRLGEKMGSKWWVHVWEHSSLRVGVHASPRWKEIFWAWLFWAKTAKKVFFIATAGRQVGLGKKFLVLAILGNGITVLRGSIMYYACTMLNHVMAILWFNAHGLTIKQYTSEWICGQRTS